MTCNRDNSSINITSKDLYLDLELEDSASKQFPIKTNTTGTVASGCALGDVEITDANVMKVSGPASVVNQIDTVVATINVDGMSTDITDRVTPVFYGCTGRGCGYDKAYAECEHSQYQCTDTEYERCGTGIPDNRNSGRWIPGREYHLYTTESTY